MSYLPGFMFVMAAIFAAPHLTEREAKVYSVLSLLAGLLIWALEP